MLTMNIWTKVGLVNGTMGEVVSIYWGNAMSMDETGTEHSMPKAILVRFPDYTGPRFPWGHDDPEWDNVLPITPRTVVFNKSQSNTTCTRSQFPLALAWAVTVHKSQGMSIGPGQVWKRVLLDLGNRELSSGLTFVALSRAMTLDCILFAAGKFPTRQRLAMCKSDTLSSRQETDSHLEILSEHTMNSKRLVISRGV